MSPVRFTMFLAFTQMAVGSVWMLAWVPRKTIGTNFYRLMVVCAVILFFFGMLARFPATDVRSVLVGHDAGTNGTPPVFEFWCFSAALAALCVYMVLLFVGRDSLVRLGGICAGGIGAVAVVTSAYAMQPLLARSAFAPLLAVTFVLSALAMGGVAVGMNLGHWYLMARLPLKPLQRVTTVLLGVMVAQSVCTVMLGLFCQPAEVREALRLGLMLETFDGIVVWMRLAVGLVFPLGLAYMIRDTAHSGSTMSATGLLYIALLAVFAGEAASRFLLLSTGIWL